MLLVVTACIVTYVHVHIYMYAVYMYFSLYTVNVCFSESRFKGKHSLDSDEEDERDEVQESRLGDEDLAAQEETTIVS